MFWTSPRSLVNVLFVVIMALHQSFRAIAVSSLLLLLDHELLN